ncbi:uncharacterized protein B0P05DRAFT_566337 [Gilbertella persicaria]|uniref:uncharacterized protein n=1 Tax=Gilbertella persicaria TaxID=101096 RepID=UPI0022202C1A|nr:uncharacterized protein B0P05DRAFT_566337 [Gilbertella persicaria]KAI8047291.1 hypothetical protein B0P05DRAFT_566337 [Gilbertella persicaria]
MNKPTVAIIGSGFSGICAAIQLRKKLGIIAEVFEATDDVGGTWNYNTYPGCACDIQSHLYSFSFELNPNWSQVYSSQKEIHAYLQHVARKYKVYEQVDLNTKVTKALWKQDINKWQLTISDQTKEFDFVFSGVGALRIPHIPDEFKSFEGKIIHSAYWDNNYDFTDKTIAVIGCGTSAIQIIPNLASRVKHLYSFQRTPSWVAPKHQKTYPGWVKCLFTWFPFLMWIYRAWIFLYRDLFVFRALKDVKSKIHSTFRSSLEKYMRDMLQHYGKPELISSLIPTFPVFCKRICLSDDYLVALCRKNVTVQTSPIVQVQGKTIITTDGQQVEVDTLCLATGFDIHNFLGDLQVFGRDGCHLNQLWEQNPIKTHKTINVHQFPNLFFLLGPGSALGHSSVVGMIESQVEYSIEIIKYMIKNNLTCLEPNVKSQEAYADQIQQGLKGTVWLGGCQSWYMNHGEIRVLWPNSAMQFYRMLRNTQFKQEYIEYKQILS